MRTQKITFEECEYSVEKAIEICEFSGFIAELHDGYIFFESEYDFKTWCNQK